MTIMPDIFQATTVPVLEQVVNFSQARHAILAGNIANLDTPGYRVRDLSVDAFHQKLKDAIESRNEESEPVSPGMLNVRPGDPMTEVRDSMKSILYHDDSDVGLEQQVTEISKNQFMHNMAIAILNSQFRMLNTAISERV